MSKKASIVIAALIILILVGGFVFQNSGFRVAAPTDDSGIAGDPNNNGAADIVPENEAPVGADDSESLVETITFTDSGYSPQTLTVQKGTSVTFRNMGSSNFWPASAIHPTHKVYPTTGGCLGSTFDACSGLTPGSSWTFKFDIAGTWNYHDHINPALRGTVVVQ